MRPEAKVQIYSVNENLPADQVAWMWGVLDQLERTRRKKNGDVADEKLNCKEKIGFVDWSCDKTYNDRHPFIFIGAAWISRRRLA